jgi:hypothetical protein
MSRRAPETAFASAPAVNTSRGLTWLTLAVGCCCVSIWFLSPAVCAPLWRWLFAFEFTGRLRGSNPRTGSDRPTKLSTASVFVDASQVSPEAAEEFQRALEEMVRGRHATVLRFVDTPPAGKLPVHLLPVKCDRKPLPDFQKRLYVELSPAFDGNQWWPSVVYRYGRIYTMEPQTIAAVQRIFNLAVRPDG